MTFKKISMIFFITGALISLFSGAFESIDNLENIRVIVLITLGIIVGLLNISERDQMSFLVSSIAFLLSSHILLSVVTTKMMVLQGIFLMLQNFMIFIAPAALVISLKFVFEYASESKKEITLEFPAADKRPTHENIWDIIVFVSVAFVLVTLVLESFFNLTPYPDLVRFLIVLDYIILGIFVIDLFVLYNKQRSIKLFFTKNWLDIIAVIPFGAVFRLTKLVRLVRIMRIFTRAHKASRVNRVSKFFSDESGFNKLLSRDEETKEAKSKAVKKIKKSKSSSKSKKKEK